MIALVRKSLACSIWNKDPFGCKSHVYFSLPLHFLSTLSQRKDAFSPKVYDVLVHKHHFSPQGASLIASDLTRFAKPENADSVLSFLERSGFSSTQLEKIVKCRPWILSARVEDDIKFKIKTFQDFGFSSEDITNMISKNPTILALCMKKKIIPSLSLLKGLLGSDYEVARLLRISGWFLTNDLEKTLVPNVKFLKSCGIPMERIFVFLYAAPRCVLLKPDSLRKSVDEAREMGFNERSKIFIHAVRVIASVGKETWELKLQALRSCGFSYSDILKMFRKLPTLFGVSAEKIKNVTAILLATGKFTISSVVDYPACLGCSIEKRLNPRLQILGILESKNLIREWPNLGKIQQLPDDKFYERFIMPYLNELGEESIVKSYVNGIR